MEFVGLLNNIDIDEDIGETWIEALLRCFDFPESPNLFNLLSQLNQLYLKRKMNINSFPVGDQDVEQCQCSVPPVADLWTWTKHFPIDKTRVLILASQQENNDVFSSQNISSQIESQWGKQGVLVLRNYVSPQCLDNEEHTAWKKLTCQLTEYVANNCPDVLFVIMGSFVIDDYKYLRDGRRVVNLIATTEDVSPFQLCNEKLKQLNLQPIQWQ